MNVGGVSNTINGPGRDYGLLTNGEVLKLNLHAAFMAELARGQLAIKREAQFWAECPSGKELCRCTVPPGTDQSIQPATK